MSSRLYTGLLQPVLHVLRTLPQPQQDLLFLYNKLALRAAGMEKGRPSSPWSLGNTGALREGHVSGFPRMLTILRRLGGSSGKPLNYCPFFSFFNTNLVLPPQIFKQLLGDSERNTIFRIKFKIPQNSPQE